MKRNRNLAIVLGVAAVAVLYIAISQATPEKMEQSFDVQSGGTLYLDSHSGSVDIVSHSSDTVEVRVEKKGGSADNFEVSFSQDSDDVRVIGKRQNRLFGGYQSVRFLVKVPEQYNVDLRTGGGSIDISDLNGKVDAHTSGGSIKLGQIVGDVDIKTSGGSIRVEEVAGNIDAHTSGGSVKAKLSQQPTADCRLTTSGGSVTAYLSPSIAVDIDASTSGGRVSSNIDVNGKIKKRSIKGTINGGGPRLTLKTSGGSVSIKEI